MVPSESRFTILSTYCSFTGFFHCHKKCDRPDEPDQFIFLRHIQGRIGCVCRLSHPHKVGGALDGTPVLHKVHTLYTLSS